MSRGDRGSSGLVEQVAGIGTEVGQLVHLEKLESKDREKLIERIRALKSWLGRDIRLYARSFVGASDPVSMAYLDRDCNLVMVDWHGNPTSQPLDRLRPELFMAVARDSTPLLVKAIEAKVEGTMRRRRPKLVARIHGVKERSFIFGRRKYRLLVLNSGGDSRQIRVMVNSKEESRRYGPFSLGRNGQREIDLGRVSGAEDSYSLGIEVNCKDGDSRRLRGQSKIDLKNSGWQEIPISPVRSRRSSAPERAVSHA